jgi:hypothetical protein
MGDHIKRNEMGDSRGAYNVLVRNLREIDHFDDLGIHGRIILNGSSKSGMGKHVLDWSASG